MDQSNPFWDIVCVSESTQIVVLGIASLLFHIYLMVKYFKSADNRLRIAWLALMVGMVMIIVSTSFALIGVHHSFLSGTYSNPGLGVSRAISQTISLLTVIGLPFMWWYSAHRFLEKQKATGNQRKQEAETK